MGRGELLRRVGLAGAFALLLVVSVAAPVLAQPVLGPPEEDPIAREEALESPQAAAERESSEYAYANLTPAQEGDLLREHFAPQLEAIDADPARILADVTLERIDSPTEALVTVEGEKVLLESEVPLRAPEEDGDLRKVELGLEETAVGYEPANPLVDLALPESADEPIGIGDEGLALTPLGTGDTGAAPLGEADLLLPGAREDTSLLLSPIAGGLELSALLASRNSPQQLAFAVTLPAGATLRAAESGGAEVVRDGEVLTRISAPVAIDAQGTEVPASLSVQGSTLTVAVAHREMDIAYPLFVDPEIVEDWTGFADTSKLNYWNWQWGGVGSEDFIGWRSCISTCWGKGLYVRARSNFTYPGGSWGRWWFTPQGSTTFMRRVVLGPINYDAHGCSANEPHGYVGVWNDYSGWKVLANAYPSGWATYVDTGSQNLGAGTRTAMVGIHAGGTVNLNCGRDYHLGGATLFLDDPEGPTVGAPSGIPSGWAKNGAVFTINVPVSDPGLGVHWAKLWPADAPEINWAKQLTCDGHLTNPCPANHTFQFTVSSGSFDEGEKGVRAAAKDVVGHDSNTYESMVRVDRKPPEIDLAGQLAEATEEDEGDEQDKEQFDVLELPVYNLKIDTSDGSTASNATKRSGVKSIEVFLDDKTMPEKVWTSASCPASSCPMSQVFTLKLNELSAATHHTLRVLAKDFAGNVPRERKVEFEYLPATGIKDEYVMHYFPLPDGTGNEAEEENPRRPELAVNLTNGNLVYRQRDVEVEGVGADLEVERFYNSLLPASQDTEWGEGWTLAQTPTLEPEEPGSPNEATMVEPSGSFEGSVELPANSGEELFNEQLQALITKEAGGGYEIADQTGETDQALALDSSGRVDELRTTGSATVDYTYAEGELSEISVEDPGTVQVDPESLDPEDGSRGPAIWHSANFATTGSADGQLNNPADLALDEAANLWVVDQANNRLQKFSPAGQFLAKFGTTGTAPGQLESPRALAIDAAGNLLVLESGRVQKFTPGGQFLSAFGAAGFGLGKFANANGITTTPNGEIWVSDFNKVQRFSSSGEAIERVNPTEGPGTLSEPEALDAGPEGNVYVADAGKDQIVVYNQDGDYLRGFGTTGTAPGQLDQPAEVDVDSAGRVWVADAATDRVELFTSAGDHLASFGSPGSGAQQFRFERAAGIASDGQGRVWLADTDNDRVSRWLQSSVKELLHSANFATPGSADGQLNNPADLALDEAANLWVVDQANNRLQKFSPAGQFLAKFGTTGTAPGQLESPRALAIDAAGNLLVLESGRVQKFTPGGQFLSAFGAAGFGLGKFANANGITTTPNGEIWVSDFNKVQRFSSAGEAIERVNPTEGPGTLSEPEALDAGPEGNVYVADAGKDQIVVYSQDGDYLRSFGTSGTAPGQLDQPAEVDVDSAGRVWVADAATDRVELFTAAGDHLASFGSPGTGAQQLRFERAAGIASDGQGRVWLADSDNDRVSEWVGGVYESPSGEEVPTEDDAQVEIEVSGELVESVAGEEAGTVSYEHSGGLLTEVVTEEGDYDYEYDGAGRMTKVTLPNGTYAQVAYEPTFARVKSVTVAIGGSNAKTTYFEYSDDPRRTVVTPPDAPATTYDITSDGSIFKWWDAKEPPIFDDIGGTLYDPSNRETGAPINPGTYNLVIQPHSEHGIASIQVIANNTQLVSEKTCDQDPETPGTECKYPVDEWVMETANWAPGILQLEAIATDRFGESISTRFWVNVPHTPPPDPEAEEPPRFNDILRFREERGLDLDLKGDELLINDRIFELMGDWNNPNTPDGAVARATAERWGVPLRAVDAAELDFRLAYQAQAASVIPNWAAAHAGSTYAGYYVDERAGGILYIGFTGGQENQAAQVKALADTAGLMVPGRVRPFVVPPAHSLESLTSLQKQINGGLRSTHPLLITGVAVDLRENQVIVGASDVNQAMNLLIQAVGAKAPVAATYQAIKRSQRASRERVEGPMRAGDWMMLLDRAEGPVKEQLEGAPCTAAFGAWDRVKSKATGRTVFAPFVLGAGHCLPSGHEVMRRDDPSGKNKQWIGSITREGDHQLGGTTVDAAAVRLKTPDLIPRKIFTQDNRPRIPVTGLAVAPAIGTEVCYSGINSRRERCGPIIGPPEEEASGDVEVCAEEFIRGGDSGSPVWIKGTGLAVGIMTSGFDEQEAAMFGVSPKACFALLMPYPGWAPASAALTNPGMAPLQLAKIK